MGASWQPGSWGSGAGPRPARPRGGIGRGWAGRGPALLRLDRQKRVQHGPRSTAFDLDEAGVMQEACVIVQGALLAFGDDQHIQGLHVGGYGANAVRVE